MDAQEIQNIVNAEFDRAFNDPEIKALGWHASMFVITQTREMEHRLREQGINDVTLSVSLTREGVGSALIAREGVDDMPMNYDFDGYFDSDEDVFIPQIDFGFGREPEPVVVSEEFEINTNRSTR